MRSENLVRATLTASNVTQSLINITSPSFRWDSKSFKLNNSNIRANHPRHAIQRLFNLQLLYSKLDVITALKKREDVIEKGGNKSFTSCPERRIE